MESSATIYTDIFESDFFQVLQERIDIAHSEELSKHVFNVPGLTKVPKRAGHFILLDNITEQLAIYAKELETTRLTISKLDKAKLDYAAELRSMIDTTQLDAVPEDTSTDSEDSKKLQVKIDEVDKKLTTFKQYMVTVREGIKALLSKAFNTPDIEWTQEQKSLRVLKLDAKLAGKPDPKLVDNLIVSIRNVLHGSVSKFWAIIPFLETIDTDRECTDFWHFPSEANDYMGVPQDLRKKYLSQSRLLFMHMWTSTFGTTQVGSSILRKTYCEKFLGDSIGVGNSVKSSQHDGMASLYYLVATHEHAGYEEKARLRTTLHHTSALFVSGNPQSKIPGIRVVLDKAMSLKVKIDYDATVKPTVMVLRKRSPNFNDLATKYLSTDAVKYLNEQWETKSLSIFDTLLSEIDQVIDVLGMHEVPGLTDAKSKSHEGEARNAFAYYTNSPTDTATQSQDLSDGKSDDKRPSIPKGFGCNHICAVNDCDTLLSKETIDKVNAYRIKKLAQDKAAGKKSYFNPKICQSCADKILSGRVQFLQSKDRKYIKVTGKNGKHHIGIERQASRSARNQQSDDSGRGRRNNGTRNIDNGDVGTDCDTKVNMQSDVTTLVRSTILDMFVPKQDNVTPDATVTTDPEKVRLDAFRAQMDRLGIGK